MCITSAVTCITAGRQLLNGGFFMSHCVDEPWCQHQNITLSLEGAEFMRAQASLSMGETSCRGLQSPAPAGGNSPVLEQSWQGLDHANPI